jgi:hypothetical protein
MIGDYAPITNYLAQNNDSHLQEIMCVQGPGPLLSLT